MDSDIRRKRRPRSRTGRGLNSSVSMGASSLTYALANPGVGNGETDERFAQLETAYRWVGKREKSVCVCVCVCATEPSRIEASWKRGCNELGSTWLE